MTRKYPNDWDSRRKKVYRQDNYTCQNCGDKGGSRGDAELHAHYIVPKSKGGSNKTSNLKTLCKACHEAIHHENKKAPTARSRLTKQMGRTTVADKVNSLIYDKSGVGYTILGLFEFCLSFPIVFLVLCIMWTASAFLIGMIIGTPVFLVQLLIGVEPMVGQKVIAGGSGIIPAVFCIYLLLEYVKDCLYWN